MKEEIIAKAVKMTNLQLRQHNSLLRKNLRRIVSCSSENEKAQERMDEMENIVFGAGALRAMFDEIIAQGRKIFEIQSISIVLEKRLEALYPESYKDNGSSVFINSDCMRFERSERLGEYFSNCIDPILRGNLIRGSEEYFPDNAGWGIKSVALVPLGFENRITGGIAFGSHNPARFLEGYGSRFLRRLSRIVSLKVEAFYALEMLDDEPAGQD